MSADNKKDNDNHGHDHGGHDHDHGSHDHGGHDHSAHGHDHHHGGHDHAHDHGGHDHGDQGHEDDHGGHDHAGHAHSHSHSHGFGGHDHSHELRNASKRSLLGAFVLITGYMFAEVIGGILSGSLALIADAGHMLTDAASIALAMVAMHYAEREATARRTFGFHRLEILAALLNALTLWLIAFWVVVEAYHRMTDVPDVKGGLMLTVGVIGLFVNVGAAWILHSSSEHSVNVEGAYQHVIADLLGSIGVVISGILIWAFGWYLADPIVSVIIAIIILRSTWGLLAKVVHVLLEGVPDHIDVYKLCSKIESEPGVTLIHDVHVWTISPGNEAFTAHILIDPEYAGAHEDLLRRVRRIVSRDFGIGHITLQLETSSNDCTEDHHVDHLLFHAHAD
ncbi:MAG: cation diffusion facilitator family transporter [Gammaproteobacteria bacterium]|nr:cation diffusion facilitator family transporter [Gammaproteobacteria bacterium]MDE0512389.1 cation diffusion facilitator family transporter [Gammaproteobacteria bacterium]